MQKRRVVILGSTGSIGTSALKVARDIPDRMEIVGLAAGTSVEALARQASEFNVRNVCIFDPSGEDKLARAFPAPRWKRARKACAAWRGFRRRTWC